MNFFCGMNRIKWIINIDPIRFIIPDQFKPEPDAMTKKKKNLNQMGHSIYFLI